MLSIFCHRVSDWYIPSVTFGGASPPVHTISARSDAAATIYFIAQFCAVSIRERRLFNSVFSVKSFMIVRALRKASFIKLTKNCDAVTWFWSKHSSLISLRFATKQYLHGTSNLFPRFLPMISHDDRPPCLKNCRTSLDSVSYRVYSCHSRHEVVHLRMFYSNISPPSAAPAYLTESWECSTLDDIYCTDYWSIYHVFIVWTQATYLWGIGVYPSLIVMLLKIDFTFYIIFLEFVWDLSAKNKAFGNNSSHIPNLQMIAQPFKNCGSFQ